MFDYLIATDDSHSKEKEQMNKENKSKSRNSRRRLKQNLDSEFGVVRGIDFKNVYTVGVALSDRKIQFRYLNEVETSARIAYLCATSFFSNFFRLLILTCPKLLLVMCTGLGVLAGPITLVPLSPL